jgi:hypothetical protein
MPFPCLSHHRPNPCKHTSRGPATDLKYEPGRALVGRVTRMLSSVFLEDPLVQIQLRITRADRPQSLNMQSCYLFNHSHSPR